MSTVDLRGWLASQPEEEILRITEPVALDYQPTALVLELEQRKRFPVVMIEHPKGHDTPWVGNIFADRGRIARIAGVADWQRPGAFHDAWAECLARPLRPVMGAFDAGRPAPVQEVVIEGAALDAGALPISRHFRDDAGRYISSGILICKDPDTGVRNLSYQRLQLKGPNRFGASLHSRGHIWEHLNRQAKRGKNLEVAVVIGAHPAIYLAAAARVAMEVDELDIAGSLLGAPVELVKCRSIDVEVPAHAEYVLEGEILGDVHEDEGPFGEYTGYSTSRSTRNVFVVKAITHRAKPVFMDIIPGYSMEHLLLGRSAKEAHVFQRLKEMVPNLRAINWPRSGTHFHAYLSIAKSAEGQARHALTLLLGLDNYVKLAIAVDDDVDVFNEEEVLWAVATRFQADTDLFTIPKMLCNRLDPSSVDGMSAKLALDATAPLDWDVKRAVAEPGALEWARKLLDK